MAAAPVEPMLAVAGPLPVGDGWAYEFKWDGVRAVAELVRRPGGGQLRLHARSGADITVAYPELAGLSALADRLPGAVLDGEIVVLSAAGTSFQALAERMHVRDPLRARQLAATLPITYLIFDLLRLAGEDLTPRPYVERRAALERLELGGEHWYVPPVFRDGPATLSASIEHGLEGVVAKRLHAPYRPGRRSPDWIKVKHLRTADLVVGGWRRGARPLGALLVGEPDAAGALRYRGRVGSGYSTAVMADLLGRLAPLHRDAPPFADQVPPLEARGAHWVNPVLVVEVAYANRTTDGRLRFPRMLRLRTDKTPDDIDNGEIGDG
jgi:bifunctional non-homologous end joining protein LigD